MGISGNLLDETIKILTGYEKKQFDEIDAWQKEEPGVASQAMGFIAAPLNYLVQKIIPHSTIAGALDMAHWAGWMMANKDDILKDQAISEVSEMRDKSLEICDKLADSVHNWAIGMAAAEGGVTGVMGLFALPIDIPAIITLSLRTIHKIGLCYGFECNSELEKQTVLGILSASSANTMQDKVISVATLRTIQVTLARQTWKAMAEKAAAQQFSKETAIIGVRNLAKQLGINITKRGAAKAIPVIGAAVGASVNGWFIKDVGWAARRAFQQQWLINKYKTAEIAGDACDPQSDTILSNETESI